MDRRRSLARHLLLVCSGLVFAVGCPGGLVLHGMPSLSPAYPAAILEAGEQALRLVRQGRFTQALPLWRRLLSWQQRHLGSDDPRSLRSLRNLAAVELASGNADEASRLYGELRSRLVRLQGPATADSIQSALDLARAWRTQTRFEPAERLLHETLALLDQSSGEDPALQRLKAEAQDLLGSIAHEQGRYEQAEQAFRSALGLRSQLDGINSFSAASAEANLAQALLRQGLYTEALTLQRQALVTYQRLTGVDSRRQQATLLSNIAFSLRLLGESQLSLQSQEEALALLSQLQGMDHPHTAHLLLNLGSLQADLGNPGQALQHYRSALKTMRLRLGPQHLGTAFALQNMAELARSQKQPEYARRWGLEALRIREKQLDPNHPDLATTLLGLGLSELALGQQSQAELHLRRALLIRRRALGPNHPYTGLSALLLGLTLWEGRYQDDATQYLEEASQAYDDFLRRQAPMMPMRQRVALMASVTEIRNTLYSLVLQGPDGRNIAFQTRLNFHGRLEEIERRQRALQRQAPDGHKVTQHLEAINAQLEGEQLNSGLRQQLEQQREVLNRKFQELQQKTKLNDLIERVSVQQIARALPVGSVLVEFLQIEPVRFRQGQLQALGEPRIIAIVLTPEENVQSIDLGPALKINKAIWQALAKTQAAALDSEQAWRRVGNLLIRPLLPQLASRHTWFLSLDGELHRVPFAALSRQETGGSSYYADVHRIRILTSARDLLVPLQSLSSERRTSLILADPDYDAVLPLGDVFSGDFTQTRWRYKSLSPSVRALRWNRLPASRAEGQSLQKILNAELLIDAKATGRALRASRPRQFLHVASHGAFLPPATTGTKSHEERQQAIEGKGQRWDDPMQRAVIVLSGANSAEIEMQNEGYMTAVDVSLLRLDGTRLVTLSACDSGKGGIYLGDGVYGLRRALAVAGAESSLLSLWKVDDRATKVLMDAFYGLIKQGKSPEDALAQSQRLMREGDTIEWRHPYAWAAFQLYGRGW